MNTLFPLLLLIAALAAVLACAWHWTRSAHSTMPQRSRRRRGRSLAAMLQLRCSLFVLRVQETLVIPFREWAGVRKIPPAQFANIGEGSFSTGVKSYLPDATGTARYLLYKIGTDGDHVAVCGAGEVPLGPSDDSADSVTTPIAINLLGLTPGTIRVVTDGTIANGDHVKAGAAGVAVKASTTDVSFGIAVIGSDMSSAAGDVITIVHCVPHKYVF